MQVTGKIIDQIHKAALRIYSNDNGRFNQFCSINKEKFLVDFGKVSATKNYDIRVFDFLELLNDKGTILVFVDTLFATINEGQKNLPEFAELRGAIDDVYTFKNNSWAFKKSAFQCSLLKAALAFIDREGIQDAIYRMVSGEGPKMLIINGQPKSGLSYIKYYLSELESNVKGFELYSIDLKRKVKSYSSDGLIRAANIAQYISDLLQMNYTVIEPLKVIPFVTRLNSILDKNKLVCMFFIDQFDVAYADDVFELIQAISDLSLESGNCYIILSGFEHTDRLSPELELFAVKEDIGAGSFTRLHIQKFYTRIYEFLEKKYTLTFTLEEFLSKVENALSEEYFLDGNNNVATVGTLLTKWFQNFNKQLAVDE